MSENEVKKAFNAIEPEDGTRERMYANILKKAAAQRAAAPEENADAPAAESNASPKTVPLPARRPTPRWKRYSAMAACLALVTTLTIGFLHPFFAGDSEGNEPAGSGRLTVRGCAERGGLRRKARLRDRRAGGRGKCHLLHLRRRDRLRGLHAGRPRIHL